MVKSDDGRMQAEEMWGYKRIQPFVELRRLVAPGTLMKFMQDRPHLFETAVGSFRALVWEVPPESVQPAAHVSSEQGPPAAHLRKGPGASGDHVSQSSRSSGTRLVVPPKSQTVQPAARKTFEPDHTRQTESGSAMILNRVPEEEQFTESLRSMPKDKPFSISSAFPEAIQTWHEEVMDEFWHHLEQTTGAQVHFSAVDTCALFGPLTSIYSAHMMIIQKARSMITQQARDIIEIFRGKGQLETGNGLEHYEYTFPQRYGAVARGNGKGNGKGKGKGKGKVKGQGKCKR